MKKRKIMANQGSIFKIQNNLKLKKFKQIRANDEKY